eukprot:NODE_2524_length_1045_cov_30.010893_g2506_i0.p1 GENE.NODE_2524_length_1045_cov_30.010893_g2506_i0~~NODE_2524_length_1045_cov_30.010893_g2506_i0.p1  ORF type:complete len:337 (-),score=61.33 NODE_2524_length_1045_cov_30.010893_g2506_i0:35-895(-)
MDPVPPSAAQPPQAARIPGGRPSQRTTHQQMPQNGTVFSGHDSSVLSFGSSVLPVYHSAHVVPQQHSGGHPPAFQPQIQSQPKPQYVSSHAHVVHPAVPQPIVPAAPKEVPAPAEDAELQPDDLPLPDAQPYASADVPRSPGHTTAAHDAPHITQAHREPAPAFNPHPPALAGQQLQYQSQHYHQQPQPTTQPPPQQQPVQAQPTRRPGSGRRPGGRPLSGKRRAPEEEPQPIAAGVGVATGAVTPGESQPQVSVVAAQQVAPRGGVLPPIQALELKPGQKKVDDS